MFNLSSRTCFMLLYWNYYHQIPNYDRIILLGEANWFKLINWMKLYYIHVLQRSIFYRTRCTVLKAIYRVQLLKREISLPFYMKYLLLVTFMINITYSINYVKPFILAEKWGDTQLVKLQHLKLTARVLSFEAYRYNTLF